MSILDRLNRLVRSNLNEALDRAGGDSLSSALDEMEASLREARREQAKMRRTERDLVQSIREARDEADHWEERAILALQKGDEELAREALKEKNAAMRKAQKMREELRNHRSHMEDIEASLEALEMKLQGQKRRLEGGRSARRSKSRRKLEDDRDRRKRRWEEEADRRRSSGSRSRSRDRDSGETPTQYDDVFDTDAEMETFDRMAGKIDAMEAEIDAMRELSGGVGDERRERLEQKFREMETEADAERMRRRSDEESGEDRGRRKKEEKDDLSGMKRRMDRLSELKDKFGDEE